MKKTAAPSIYVRVALRTILCFAVFHLIYLIIAAVAMGDWTLISLFSILDLSLVLPSAGSTGIEFLAGLAIIAVTYGICYKITKRDASSL